MMNNSSTYFLSTKEYEASTNLYVRQGFQPTTSSNFTFSPKKCKRPSKKR